MIIKQQKEINSSRRATMSTFILYGKDECIHGLKRDTVYG